MINLAKHNVSFEEAATVFADLIPGSGHGSGGYVNVASFEVYGKPVKR